MIKISCKEYAANLKEELKELCEKSPRQRCLTVIQIGNDVASFWQGLKDKKVGVCWYQV